ncbi:MAG: hypothetical protein ACM31L_20630 [Actinomycetota bacterium]
MSNAEIGPETAGAKFVRLVTSTPIVALCAIGTLNGAFQELLFGGALLFSGKPQPIPFFMFPGMVLLALTIPMAVSLVIRNKGGGGAFVVVTQAALVLFNLLYWVAYYIEVD